MSQASVRSGVSANSSAAFPLETAGDRVTFTRRLRGMEQGDWVLVLLIAAVVAILPLELDVSGWVPGDIPWLWVAFGAGALGMLLARSRWEGGAAWLFSVLLSAALALVVVGELAPPWPMVRGDLARVWHWVWDYVSEGYRNPELPLSYGATHFCWQASALFERLISWQRAISAGQASTDTAALLIGVWVSVWMLSWNAAFQLGRHRGTWTALVPLGVAILVCVGYTGLGMGYARLFLALALIISVWANAGRMVRQWLEAGVGVTRPLRRQMFLTGLPIASLILAVALILPYGENPGTTEFLWDRVGDRLNALYETWDRAFAGRNPVPKPDAQLISRAVSEAGVPVSSASLDDHDIRGGVSNSEEILFRVQTSDIPPREGYPAPKRYWRERTYDRYTGTGWATSHTEVAEFPASALWKDEGYPYVALAQAFTMERSVGLSPAVNEPVLVETDYSIRTRGDGDLAGFYAQADIYTVRSLVPAATVPELRAAQQEYAAWAKERYLSLPAIPARVHALAQRIVSEAGAATRYDQAVAIETYLRGFVYDLEVEPPADGIDVVDYYLFATQRGYCDYSATAMVVMLRSVGVVARYASGYGQGEYDPTLGAWVVRGRNAHAWVEVYFPGYGWIEFEPTASQSPFARGELRPTLQPTPTASPVATAEPTPRPADASDDAPSPKGGVLNSRFARLVLVAGVALLGVIILAGLRARARPRDPRQLIGLVYGQLQRRARKLGFTMAYCATPREWVGAFAAGLGHRFEGASEMSADLSAIGRFYEQACYGAAAPSADDGARALAAWERLRRLLHGGLRPMQERSREGDGPPTRA